MACEKRTNGSLFYLATDGSDIKKNVALENSEEFLNASREALYILFDFNEPLSEWFELQRGAIHLQYYKPETSLNEKMPRKMQKKTLFLKL